MTATRKRQVEDLDRLTDTLRGIELTEEGRRPQREIVFVTDEEMTHVLDDPVRMAIIKILKKGVPDTITTKTRDEETGDLIIRQREVRRHALSVIEIVKLSAEDEEVDEITKNQVYHHLPKLIEAGYVIKYGTVTTGKRTTDYYRRTAKGFVIASSPVRIDVRVIKKKAQQAVERIDKVFDLQLTADDKSKLVDLIIASERIEAKGRARIARMIKGDVVDSDVLELYNFLLNVYSCGMDDWLRTQREIRKILFPDE
ncbi:MAG: hypothetical protein ACTSVT_12150 [Candidatus Thorarchaeota archaeon]